MTAFTDPFVLRRDDHRQRGMDHSFHYDIGYLGFDSNKDSRYASSSIFSTSADESFCSPVMSENTLQTPIYSDSLSYSKEINEMAFDEVFSETGDPILPPPAEMIPKEGFALRQWHRQNATRLEAKERREKDLLNKILDEADLYKIEFYRRKTINCETEKSNNREKEKVYLANQQKFHAEASKQYWNAIAELIPHEIASIEKNKDKKDAEKKSSIVTTQGPKPGKPTDLSRMRQIILKLKHSPPSHMNHLLSQSITSPDPSKKDANAGSAPTPKTTTILVA